MVEKATLDAEYSVIGCLLVDVDRGRADQPDTGGGFQHPRAAHGVSGGGAAVYGGTAGGRGNHSRRLRRGV